MAGRWFTRSTAFYQSSSFLHCFFPFLQTCIFSSLPFNLCFSQCDNFTSDLCWGFFPVRYQEECTRCIKRRKKTKIEYQLASTFCIVTKPLNLYFSQCNNAIMFPPQSGCSRCIKLRKKVKGRISASGKCSKDGTSNPTQITKVAPLKETTKHFLIRSQNILLYSITNFFDYFLTDSLTQNWHRQF